MTDDEVEVLAAELAKAGGISWYPGRERGPLKLVADRYRDRARLAIAVLDRYRASKEGDVRLDATAGDEPGTAMEPRPRDSSVQIGSTVLYRPPGDRRSYPCRIEKIDGSRAYLVPDLKNCTGWVEIRNLLPATVAGPGNA